MSLEDLRQTQNTPDGRDLSSLLVIMTFSSTVLEDPRFQHSQPVSDFDSAQCGDKLKKVLPRIARNVLVAIDSSIGPLSQSEFPNYNERPDEIMPLDTSKFMLKTVGSYWGTENLERPLKDILFRPSWFSLLSHILFNSQKYEQKPVNQDTRPMTHVVTGSSGVGKSALRFPAITLALSLGANEVCSAKANEYPLKFVRNPKPPVRSKKTSIKEQALNLASKLAVAPPPRIVKEDDDINTEGPLSESIFSPHSNPRPAQEKVKHSPDSEASHHQSSNTPARQLKQLTMRVTHVNEPPQDVTVTPTMYKYDVFLYDALVGAQDDQDKEYGDHIFKGKEIKLGEVEVPSIHHFPHFLRLFVDRCDQVRNPLEGKTWHIVDDLILDSDDLESSHHYILLTAPNQTHLKQAAFLADQSLISLALYVLPKYTLAEEVNLLNAIPCQSDQLDVFDIKRLKQIVETDGFTPWCMQPVLNQGPPLEERVEKVIASKDVIGQSISHNLIVLDSPQADPLNFTTAYASPRAEELVAGKWTEKLEMQHNFFDDPAHCFSSDELKNYQIPALFKRLTNSAIRQGAQFSQMRIGGKTIYASRNQRLSFPPTPTRSGVDLSGTCDTLHAFLPDMAEFQCSAENRFDDDKWGRFFVKPMIAKPFMSGPVEEKKGNSHSDVLASFRH
ncbi:hypothetical protein BLNAU_7733 [Blattamonas nauphoetae]|uniref:Uncharacterized protein n=1 Tax=Blattamonas nauphoetae TaxID=2049346 RepID=A0ABQ9Y0V0_9EUKA|nr:hypothetical protein BLNAU_7733 [Blattamonas nauphoetae]